MAAIVVATAINFLLSSLVTGTQVTIFVVSIRKAVDIDYPLEKLDLVKKAVWNLYLIVDWAANIPVGIVLSLLDSLSNNAP